MWDSDRGKKHEIDYSNYDQNARSNVSKNKTEVSESEEDSGGYYESSEYEHTPTPDPESKPSKTIDAKFKR